MKKKQPVNRINFYIQTPITEDNYHEIWCNGQLFCIVWGKPLVQKRDDNYIVSFEGRKLNFYVTNVFYHEEKIKTEVKT